MESVILTLIAVSAGILFIAFWYERRKTNQVLLGVTGVACAENIEAIQTGIMQSFMAGWILIIASIGISTLIGIFRNNGIKDRQELIMSYLMLPFAIGYFLLTTHFTHDVKSAAELQSIYIIMFTESYLLMRLLRYRNENAIQQNATQ